MREEKYTPGPWEVFRRANANSESLQIKTEYGSPYMDESELMPVVMLGKGGNQKANAELIAAAPMLYEALKSVEWYECAEHFFCSCCQGHKVDGHYSTCKLRAALDAVEGK